MSELVREIVEVTAWIAGDEENPQLTVEAEGLAPTAGWTNVRLDPHVYITPPEAAWEGPLDDWCIGVRVHAVDNLIEDELFEPWDEDDDASEAA